MENSHVHMENSPIYVENSPDLSRDPFGLEKLILELEKKHTNVEQAASGRDALFSPGFTPLNSNQSGNEAVKNVAHEGIINRWHGAVVVKGDFNEVCFASKRHGSTLYASNEAEFITFITNSHLIDVPLGGYSFTWSDKHANGEWIDNPDHFKREFYNYFTNIFSAPDWYCVPMDGIFSRHLGVDSSHDLEGDISVDEIKKVVWDCGSDKSLGPDGFTFEFF
nr:RNA-directed DNA polymerase, eukaryota [Tanacetum cinerariifolium]